MLAFKTVLFPWKTSFSIFIFLNSSPIHCVKFFKSIRTAAYPHVSIHPIIPLLHNPVFAIQCILTVVIYLFPN